jgi:hypothetical protein
MIRRLLTVRRKGVSMADYIDREILCQAYVHIETELNEEQLANLKDHLALYISSRGRFFLYEAVSTDVEFKEGSLKIRLSILGSLYIAIAQYGSFRDGTNFLVSDAKRLAETVISESLFLTKSRHDATIRTEARIGVAGSLKNCIDRMESIKNEMGRVSLQTSTRQLSDLKDDMDKLLANLNDPADPPYVAGELCKLAHEVLPRTPLHDPKKPRPGPEAVAAYHRVRQELIDELNKEGKRPKRRSQNG